MSWKNPLPSPLTVPDGDHPGAFGTKRKHDTHTGVDLYTEPGTHVAAVEDGIVVAYFPFTGPEAESPWWHSTYALMIEGKSGVVLYGEILSTHKPGELVKAGDIVGHVMQVLKRDKGKPMCMLHLELYRSGTRDSAWWRETKPESLLDPTPMLKGC